jgi:hypothetical protein
MSRNLQQQSQYPNKKILIDDHSRSYKTIRTKPIYSQNYTPNYQKRPILKNRYLKSMRTETSESNKMNSLAGYNQNSSSREGNSNYKEQTTFRTLDYDSLASY